MNRILNKVWGYWLITDLLLILEVTVWQGYGLMAAAALTLLQTLHFFTENPRISAFPVQVRIAYLLLLVIAFWPPLYWLLYPVILGTTAMVLFDYCFLARFMSLMPWNHNQRFSWSMIYQTFFSKPVEGSVMKN
ncbi:hypothetical protein [Thiomicrorhabdus sp. 6S3-12]|uniref:hypothetical protein n=1 Tax=Thiomicrorhabdus sp. 6S3-12 TaxID=2819681 RepID=UPI001AADB9B1|nr:hypothetical protein [Thiomicrorhabdus sp. 6S3-12]MBO1924075.1 hypothetical protein [Thiomicrorhabdus sp. 6S3-12]